MIQTLVQRWAALSARERQMIGAGAVLLVIALLWALAYEPAARGREKLLAERANWQADLARMDALVAQARQLGPVASAEAPSLEALRERLEASLAAAGLSAQVQSIRTGSDLIELRLKSVPAQAWISWLDAVLRETRMRVGSLSVERDGPPAPPGRVTVRITLDRPDKRV